MKYLILSLLTVSFISVASAQDAVSPQGNCETFASESDIPEDYKKVTNCSLVEDKNRHVNLEEFQNIRYHLKSRGYTNKTKRSNQGRLSNRNFLRSSNKIGITNQRRVVNRNRTDYSNQRTFTRKTFNRSSYQYAQRVNRNKGGYKHEGELSEQEKRNKNKTWYGAGSGTRMDRTSKLSSKPKWTVQQRSNMKKLPDFKNRTWRTSDQTNQINRKKKVHSYDGPRLQRIYKGQRLDGNIDQELIDQENN